MLDHASGGPAAAVNDEYTHRWDVTINHDLVGPTVHTIQVAAA